MPIMVATTIETVDGWTRMVYHRTCVAQYQSEKVIEQGKMPYMRKQIKLNTGGYATVTTKRRMNQFAKMFDLGFSVYQQKGQWYIISKAKTRL